MERLVQNNGDGTFLLVEGDRQQTVTAEEGSPELIAAIKAFFTADPAG